MRLTKILCSSACLLLAAVTMGSLAACGEGEAEKPARHEHTYVDGICECGAYEEDFITGLPMSQDLQAACDQQGTVVDVEYDTRSYAYEAVDGLDVEIPITKKAQVYLPYGYDETKQYNVIYLMHGAGETYSYWLTKMGTTTRNVLDNMIKNGLCEPVIAICTTWNADPADWTPGAGEEEGTEEGGNQAVTLADEQEGGQAEQPRVDLTGSYPIELRNDIIPFMETHFSTYAGGDVSAENIKATREHRAFAGFSMGSITSIEVLKQCPDLFYYIGSYSFGSDGSAINEALSAPEFDDLEFGYWFNQNGTADYCLESQQEMVAYIRENMTDKFTDGKNFAYIEIPGGSHAYNCWIIGLYNSLLVFYK